MNDAVLNSEYQSDKFRISINELLFSRSYRPTVESLSKLLDENGYFGRYKIETVESRKHGIDLLIKVHIYLYNSVYTYTWPSGTFFNADKKIFGHNRKSPRGILNNKILLLHMFGLLSTIFHDRRSPHDMSRMFNKKCEECYRIIVEEKRPINDWPYIISHIHQTYKQRPFMEKLFPFLAKTGLIVNNRFRIINIEDADEVCKNLFDVDYWQNI
jgi:hypothetical protein